MKVQGITMLHISRESKWKTGDIIISGENENEFWLKCKDYSPVIKVDSHEISVFKMLRLLTSLEVTRGNIDLLLSVLKDVSMETAMYIREQVFEDVRKECYPHLPSRQRCLWVSEEEQLSYWKTMAFNTQRCLLTLELNGLLFCADEGWLTIDTFSSIEYADRAHHYWSGELTATSTKEYLFYGEATVISVQPFI